MAEAKRAGARLEGPTTNDLGCRWYVAVGGETRGPFAYEALLEEARCGRIGLDAHVWRPGFEHWIAVTARPDVARALPERPALGLVPPTLEAARAMATEELRYSRDVVHEALAPPPATMDLPRVPTLDAVEAESLDAYERNRWSEPTHVLRDLHGALAEGMARSEALEAGVTDLDAVGGSGVGALGAEREPASAPLPDDVVIGELQAGLRRERWTRLALVAVLIGLLVGLGALAWRQDQGQGLIPIPGRVAPPPAPASDPSPPTSEPPPPVVRRASLELGGRPRPTPVESRGRSPSSAAAPAERAAATSERATRNSDRAAPAKGAPKDEGTAENDLGWLNRRPQAPEPVLVSQASSAPRRFRLADRAPESAVDLPVALPEGLTDERAGRAVSERLSAFASCGHFDRLSGTLPAGARVELVVESGGRVAEARAAGASTEVARCLERSARTLAFAPFTRPSERVTLSFARAGTVRARVER